ncbi:hypothetical protein ACQP2Y_42220 [Actinoplanes sp. CA-051413]|uniref:hypothetical protein n=1 Tax=Actinoplanes sp. CA-051413 TaxID=3239899 RepID=UPI003D99EAE8
MHRWKIAVGTAGTLAAFTLAASAGVRDASESESMVITAAHGDMRGYDNQQPFGIAMGGKAPKGLYPGVVREMKLTLRNPYDFALSVKSLRGEVVASSKRKCKPVAANLVPRSYTGKLPIVIPPRGRLDAKSIPLYMPPAASQACSGAVFTIRLSGTATKAYR